MATITKGSCRQKAVVNIKNDDDRCFMRNVLAKHYPEKIKPERISSYTSFVNELNFSGITVPVEDIDLFEENNPGISVNIYRWQTVLPDKLQPVKVSPFAPSYAQPDNKHVDLLLVSDGDNFHYTIIRTMSQLISFTTKDCQKQELCRKCD